MSLLVSTLKFVSVRWRSAWFDSWNNSDQNRLGAKPLSDLSFVFSSTSVCNTLYVYVCLCAGEVCIGKTLFFWMKNGAKLNRGSRVVDITDCTTTLFAYVWCTWMCCFVTLIMSRHNPMCPTRRILIIMFLCKHVRTRWLMFPYALDVYLSQIDDNFK